MSETSLKKGEDFPSSLIGEWWSQVSVRLNYLNGMFPLYCHWDDKLCVFSSALAFLFKRELSLFLPLSEKFSTETFSKIHSLLANHKGLDWAGQLFTCRDLEGQRYTCCWVVVLPLASSVAIGKQLNLAGPQFFHSWNGEIIILTFWNRHDDYISTVLGTHCNCSINFHYEL